MQVPGVTLSKEMPDVAKSLAEFLLGVNAGREIPMFCPCRWLRLARSLPSALARPRLQSQQYGWDPSMGCMEGSIETRDRIGHDRSNQGKAH